MWLYAVDNKLDIPDATSDDFHLTVEGLGATPLNPTKFSPETRQVLVNAADELIADLPNHLMFTKYAGKWMGNYVLSEMRDITDKIDVAIAKELGVTDLLPALEHAYFCVYKPTGERPGTLREIPFK